MTKEIQNPNVKGARRGAIRRFRHSDFGILSDSVIRDSDLRLAVQATEPTPYKNREGAAIAPNRYLESGLDSPHPPA
jgi:hypothetical protein